MQWQHAMQNGIDGLTVSERIVDEADVAARRGRVEFEVGNWGDVGRVVRREQKADALGRAIDRVVEGCMWGGERGWVVHRGEDHSVSATYVGIDMD